MMSDMQKVRVSLTDAEGKRHEVVGYAPDPRSEVLYSNSEGRAYGQDYWYMELGSEVPFTVIQELPTGLGAVVMLDNTHGEAERILRTYIRLHDGSWVNADGYGEKSSDEVRAEGFTVLSEGIK